MTTTAILGLGASGDAAARLALHQGESVYVSDLRTDPSTAARAANLQALGADVELGQHDLGRLVAADTVVVSPGIPPDAPVLRDLHGRGVRWISEPEFAFRFLHGALIAVTGTNGKTTTCVLTDHLLREGEVRVALGGNLGGGLAPAASALPLLDPDPDWVVLEMSSFQLADIDTFRPDIGVVTTLAPDHLDRYPSVEAYYADKARLFENADDRCRWVLNGDLPEVEALAGDAPGARYRFGVGAAPEMNAYLANEVLTLRLDGREEPLLPVSELPLLGRHNVANALAAALVARLVGLDVAAIAQGLRTARPLPHRLEAVAENAGILWVNDSKATNVAAAVSAILSLDRPLLLLLGGKDKGEDLAPLARAVVGRVRAAICYGAAGPRMADALEIAGAPVIRVNGGLNLAVELAREKAQEGDVVLLAPACSSFDEFANYEARGRRFTLLARQEAA
jgi:UDP-N-acetylmuramoylalanine--D-glutamate ligase